MKKNIVFIAKSLDGYIAGKDGNLDWLHAIPNPDNDDMGFNGLMSEIDAIVMGRTTFETVVSFGVEWPYTKPVFVLSHTLNDIPEHLENKVFLVRGSLKEVLRIIHEKGWHTLYIDGGQTIQNFLSEGLIDEFRITTIPILLGGGTLLFGELDQSIMLEHITSKVFLNQIVQDHYRVKDIN